MSTPATATSHIEFLTSRGAVIDESAEAPVHFGNPEKELASFTQSAALVDRTGRSCIVQEGADALDLLHRLTTNELISLEPGDACFTVMTTERGRIVDVLQVVHLEQGKLLLLSDSTGGQQTIDWIEKFTIIEDSAIRDGSTEQARFAVVGPRALELVNSAFGVELVRGRSSEQGDIILVASQWADCDRVDVVTPRTDSEAVWDRLAESGAIPAGDTSFQAARINNGVPVAQHELTEDSNPLEVRLNDLISFTKGCYVGQEVVARLDTYDKLQKRLVAFESKTPLTLGAKLSSGGKRAGIITSVSPLVIGGTYTGLGFARRDFWANGTVLEFDGSEVTVKELSESSPFS